MKLMIKNEVKCFKLLMHFDTSNKWKVNAILNVFYHITKLKTYNFYLRWDYIKVQNVEKTTFISPIAFKKLFNQLKLYTSCHYVF